MNECEKINCAVSHSGNNGCLSLNYIKFWFNFSLKFKFYWAVKVHNSEEKMNKLDNIKVEKTCSLRDIIVKKKGSHREDIPIKPLRYFRYLYDVSPCL